MVLFGAVGFIKTKRCRRKNIISMCANNNLGFIGMISLIPKVMGFFTLA